MKIDRQRRARRVMSYFAAHAGFQPPFYILCDGPLLHYALDKKVFLRDELPSLLGGAAHVCVTACIYAELRTLGEAYSGAAMFARRAQRIPCAHEPSAAADSKAPPTIPASECVLTLLRDGNARRLILATRDAELLRCARRLSDVPILSLNRTALSAEPPSSSARAAVERRERRKLDGDRRAVRRTCSRLLRESGGGERGVDGGGRPVRKRRRGAKGPNPLSMLRKKAERRTKGSKKRAAKRPLLQHSEKGESTADNGSAAGHVSKASAAVPHSTVLGADKTSAQAAERDEVDVRKRRRRKRGKGGNSADVVPRSGADRADEDTDAGGDARDVITCTERPSDNTPVEAV